MIGVSVGLFVCVCVCLFVDTKTSSLSETEQFITTYQSEIADVSSFLALLNLAFNPGDLSLKRLLPQLL